MTTDSEHGATEKSEFREHAGSMLQEVHVRDAVGMVLAHDLTQIIPGRFKGRLFRKGHIVREEDIEALLDIGKEHLYILKLQDGYIHENEAGRRLARSVAGDLTAFAEPSEGKVTVKAAADGLAKIDADFVHQANDVDPIVLSTIVGNKAVHAGDALAGTRVIPLVAEEAKIRKVEAMAEAYRREHGGKAPIYVKTFQALQAGLITTGSEVYNGRIQDKFGPIVKQKLQELGSDVAEQRFAPDDRERIADEIHRFAAKGVDLILLTGGMSVDPDDRTPGAIKHAGARIVNYGTPMLPGSMLLMAYLDAGQRTIPVMGLPGCVMHDPYTSFDVLLPRICAGERIERRDIITLGYGGMQGC